ncbi:hypothetical protein BVX99_03120 [bacterium F16]|nr:hypothetical protein BVX99_03120 [bacterium F16]
MHNPLGQNTVFMRWLASRDAAFLAASVVITGTFVFMLLSWTFNPPKDQSVWGIFQGDMPTYIMNAKATTARTLFLTYECPYDINEVKPSVMIQLPISLLAVFLKMGISEVVIVLVIRLVFGSLMFYFIYLIIKTTFKNTYFGTVAFLIICLGGGLAWVSPLFNSSGDFWAGIAENEQAYYWWFFNIFRNLMYPFELIYHCLLFGQIYFLIKNRWKWATLLMVLGLLSNPFLSIHMIAIHLVFLAHDYKKAPDWRRYYAILPIALWALYYKAVLPSFPIWNNVMTQHSNAYQSPMTVYDFAQAYGIAILGLMSLIHKPFRDKCRGKRELLAAFSLIIITLLLVNHTRFPFLPSLQPLHFSRGYLFFGLWIVLLKWLEVITHESSVGVQKVVPYLLAVLAIATLPDNISFVRDQLRTPPLPKLLSWKQDRQKILETLRTIPQTGNVLIGDWDLNLKIGCMTHHKVLFGTPYTTPDFQERKRDTIRYLINGAKERNYPTFKKWRPDRLIK